MSFVPPFLLIDRYEVVAEIGRGGQSVVFRARDRVLQRDVAIKLLREDAASEQMLARFRQETELTARLEHAHILHVYDTGTYEGLPFIVMELAPGQTLADRMRTERQLPIGDALQIAREVGLALGHAHARGIVHRDVKPDNILLGPGGALLADFGVAMVTSAARELHITSTGTAVGTLLYMSPEQLCAEPNIDARADQYALACVLYEMLAGVGPHVASSFEGLRMMRMSARHTPVSMHRPAVSRNVERAIDRALASMSADRFRDMSQFLAALDPAATVQIEHADVHAPAMQASERGLLVPRIEPAGSRAGRTWHLAKWILAAFLAFAVISISFVAFRSRSTAADIRNDDISVLVAPVMSSGGDGESTDGAADSSSIARFVETLRAELRAWQGVRVVDAAHAREAGFIVQVTATPLNDSLNLRATIGKAGGPQAFSTTRTMSRAAMQRPGSDARSVVLELLANMRKDSATAATIPNVQSLSTRSLSALTAYVDGFRALQSGQLDEAVRHFESAASNMPNESYAQFWAAQSTSWLVPGSVNRWSTRIESAARMGLHGSLDSLLAAGLVQLARREYPAACNAYREATKLDAASFIAWYGLGECQRLDNLVVRGEGAIHFRGSHWGALNAFRNAASNAPSGEWLGALFTPILRVTYAEGTRARAGRDSASSGNRYLALVSVSADSLAMQPVLQTEFEQRSAPDSWLPAVRRGQAIARELTAAAVERWPESPQLWLQRAIALELSGIVTPSGDQRDATSALARAVALPSSVRTRAQIAVVSTRISIRRGDFTGAAQSARRVLATTPARDVGTRRTLVPLAMLVDDTTAIQALAPADPEADPSIPPALADSLSAFHLRALSGACGGLAQKRAALDLMFDKQFSSTERAEQRRRLLVEPYLAAVPCLGVAFSREFTSPILIHRVYRHLADRNRPAARALLDTLRQSRRSATAASVTWDAIYAESWAAVEAGDTVAARTQLTNAINNIASMSIFTLDQAAQSAGLRRGLALLVSISDLRTADPRWAQWSKALTPH